MRGLLVSAKRGRRLVYFHCTISQRVQSTVSPRPSGHVAGGERFEPPSRNVRYKRGWPGSPGGEEKGEAEWASADLDRGRRHRRVSGPAPPPPRKAFPTGA